jgi:hypothetical protein
MPSHHFVQGIQIAAPGIGVWNPSFDVTPAELITGKKAAPDCFLLILLAAIKHVILHPLPGIFYLTIGFNPC